MGHGLTESCECNILMGHGLTESCECNILMGHGLTESSEYTFFSPHLERQLDNNKMKQLHYHTNL
jgi:long-subunit acyl-CoA synthetase (AMP-forming)